MIFYLSGLYSVDRIIPEVHAKEILFDNCNQKGKVNLPMGDSPAI